MKKYIHSIGFFIFASFLIIQNAWPQQAGFPEEQRPDESFPTYFARLTRGGSFPGIYLNANEKFAEAFRQFIRKNFWMGPLQKTQTKLQNNNYDLWGDIYQTERPQKFVQFSPSWDSILSHYCKSQDSVSSKEIADLPFADWSICMRRALIEELIFEQGIAEKLAESYQISLAAVRAQSEIFLLNHNDFVAKLKEAGWAGPIYFRGATVPNPIDSEKRWIILNDDLLKQYTGFDRRILQMFELVGIANHELSHVMQDLKGRQLGFDVQVRNAEQVLLIEGQAEYLAEKSFQTSGLFFELFAHEQAVEVVNREGNSQTGQLFPYTIGLPFVATVYKNDPSIKTTNQILKILGNEDDLEKFLIRNF